MKNLLLALPTLLLFSATALAHEPPRRQRVHHDEVPVGGFVIFGLSSGRFREEDDSPSTYEIESENGGGINLAAALRFEPGLMVRGSYVKTVAEEYESCDRTTGVCGTFDEDLVVRQERIGVFFAPPLHGRPVGFRAGGGYASFMREARDSNNEIRSDGGFIEGAIVIDAGRVVTFDAGLVLLGLDNDFGDAGGAEIFGNAMFHAGPVDVGIGMRSLAFTTEVDGTASDYEFTQGYAEGRVMVGMQWGYGSRR
jgi:hypothetical protein